MSGLRVLITNMSLSFRSGTETYVRDLAINLARTGHSPVVFSTQLGELAEEIRQASVPVVSSLDQVGARPDIIHGQHTIETWAAVLRFPATPAIFVCHDARSWHDAPPKSPNLCRYVAVDVPCRDRLLLQHGIDESKIRMIGNAVDLDRFQLRLPLPDKPATALLYSNYAGQAQVDEISAACSARGIRLDAVGHSIGGKTSTPELLLPQHDIVFAKGRSAMEAAACGCAVIICDARGCGPMVKSKEVEKLVEYNFGGRLLSRPVRRDIILQQLDRYKAKDARKVAEIIRERRELGACVAELVACYREAIEDHRESPVADSCAAASESMQWWAANWSRLLQEYGAQAVDQALQSHQRRDMRGHTFQNFNDSTVRKMSFFNRLFRMRPD